MLVKTKFVLRINKYIMCYKCQETINTFYVLYIITAVRSVDMKKWDRSINGKVKLNKTGTGASDLKSLYTVFKIVI